MSQDPVYLFWDNSNVFIPAQFAAEKNKEANVRYDVRIQFDNLFKLALGGRTLARGLCVGSVPPELEAVWSRLRRTGLEVELFERGAGSGHEQGVDQCLQVHMLRTLADIDPPATAVLLTGDGAGYDDGVGFHADLERMHKRGWGIEVLSWDAACSNALKTWANSAGVFIPLDQFYRSITFVQHGRNSEPLSMKGRRWASPRGV